jgi:hypothetical protein
VLNTENTEEESKSMTPNIENNYRVIPKYVDIEIIAQLIYCSLSHYLANISSEVPEI